jgi:hypothetical protein
MGRLIFALQVYFGYAQHIALFMSVYLDTGM